MMPRLATDDQVAYINDLLVKTGEDQDEWLAEYEVERLEDLTRAQASACIEELKALLH